MYTDDRVPALGHSYGEWKVVKDATASETGLEEQVCSRCGAKNQKIIGKRKETAASESPEEPFEMCIRDRMWEMSPHLFLLRNEASN